MQKVESSSLFSRLQKPRLVRGFCVLRWAQEPTRIDFLRGASDTSFIVARMTAEAVSQPGRRYRRLGTRLRGLFDEAWERARRRRRRWMLVILGISCAAAGIGSIAGAPRDGGKGSPAASSKSIGSVNVAVTPSLAGKHAPITVIITADKAAGVFGDSRHSYWAEAHYAGPALTGVGVNGLPASACIGDRDRGFPDISAAGTRVRAELDPARGEGGELGWCRGLFRGAVTYFEGFACPDKGVCHVPAGFPERRHVVARFSFRVR
jgi:hypothetical protein